MDDASNMKVGQSEKTTREYERMYHKILEAAKTFTSKEVVDAHKKVSDAVHRDQFGKKLTSAKNLYNDVKHLRDGYLQQIQKFGSAERKFYNISVNVIEGVDKMAFNTLAFTAGIQRHSCTLAALPAPGW